MESIIDSLRRLPRWLTVKNPPANAGDASSIPGSGRSPGGGYHNPTQYYCLENPMDRGALAGYNPQGRKESDMTEHTLDTLDRASVLKD